MEIMIGGNNENKANKMMRNIERLGEVYCIKFLEPWDKERLQNNWWEALKFFFSHSFMRGRRDKLSNEYYYFTIKTLENYFAIADVGLDTSYKRLKKQRKYFNKDYILLFKKDKKLGRKNCIKHKDFKKLAEKNPIIKLLVTPREVEIVWGGITYVKNISLNNNEDVMMVLDVLNFISLDDRNNIYNYLKNTMKEFGTKKAYNELVRIRAISDKIAAFILRDIGLMNSNIEISNSDFKFVFPVDTWVIKIARKLGCSSEDIQEIKDYLIGKCNEFNVDPLKFAAGLWFLGFHSLDISLDCLKLIEIGDIISSSSK